MSWVLRIFDLATDELVVEHSLTESEVRKLSVHHGFRPSKFAEMPLPTECFLGYDAEDVT